MGLPLPLPFTITTINCTNSTSCTVYIFSYLISRVFIVSVCCVLCIYWDMGRDAWNKLDDGDDDGDDDDDDDDDDND